MGDDRWSYYEDAVGPRYTALALIFLLLAYSVAGYMDSAA
jgi:hypothetical protein